MVEDLHRSHRQPCTPFVIYLVLLFTAWTFWAVLIYPHAVQLGANTFAYAAVISLFHGGIFVLPVLLYLRWIDHVNPFQYLKLTQSWKRGLAAGLILALADFLVTWLRTGPPHWNPLSVSWNTLINTSILVGFFEEIPFRGFILQKLQDRFPFWKATLISALLFMAIHIPGYLVMQTLSLYNLVYLFLFGVVMAIIFLLSKSLWSSIVAHSINDFISLLIFHG
jgi:uncharacterized protein